MLLWVLVAVAHPDAALLPRDPGCAFLVLALVSASHMPLPPVYPLHSSDSSGFVLFVLERLVPPLDPCPVARHPAEPATTLIPASACERTAWLTLPR